MKNDHRKAWRFKLIPISGFDARRGYKRCPLPGVGIVLPKRQTAIADFWRDRTGKLVVRFSSQGYRFSFRGLLVSGKEIPDNKIEEFGLYIDDVLFDWLIEGVDDWPESI
jgi:hypothetical protein